MKPLFISSRSTGDAPRVCICAALFFKTPQCLFNRNPRSALVMHLLEKSLSTFAWHPLRAVSIIGEALPDHFHKYKKCASLLPLW